MILLILRIFTVINVIIGLALLASAIWPAADPSVEKKPILVVIYLLWAIGFLGLGWVIYSVKPIARKWTFCLYSLAAAGAVWVFLSSYIDQDPGFIVYPWVYFWVCLLFFVIFLVPIFFMNHRNVRQFFEQYQDNRLKAEEESARATLRNRP